MSAEFQGVRFVVMDTETTGLNPLQDRIVSIGAVALRDGEIRLDDCFETLLRQEYNTSAVAVHGVTREESLAGMEEPDALAAFREYLGDGVIVGHHIGHDIAALNAGFQRHFGWRMSNLSLDTMDLTLHLEKDGAFADRPPIQSFTLDALCEMFQVTPHDRHTAAGDALITALVAQRLFRLARKVGRDSVERLAEAWVVQEEG
ncbi:MAG: 3'-5' exonuclease [Acidimicrobiia bacterium]|nr:3'-5' exonuclease [Acidimicrobiia bacterium]